MPFYLDWSGLKSCMCPCPGFVVCLGRGGVRFSGRPALGLSSGILCRARPRVQAGATGDRAGRSTAVLAVAEEAGGRPGNHDAVAKLP